MFGIHRSIAVSAAVLGLALSPVAVAAQAPLRLGLGGGISTPVGDIAETSSVGVNFIASLTYTPPRLPFGMEIDATFHNFAAKADGGRNSHVMSVTGGITIPIAGTIGQPYLFGGAGYYNTQGPMTETTDAERDLGAYGGVGIRWKTSKAQFHVRAGFHEIFAEKSASGKVRSREMIPISIGVIL
jgi:hypothetical protein